MIDVTDLQNLRLEFASLCDTEAGYDYCIVEVSTNGVSWDEVARYDGLSNSFDSIEIDLPQLAGATTAQFRFRLQSDFSITDDGWHVDDIRLRGAGPLCLTGDADSDGIADGADNCTQVANPDQRDTNGDGIGNICDPDVDNNGVVNFADLAIVQGNFFVPGDLDTDFNGDGQTNFRRSCRDVGLLLRPAGPGRAITPPRKRGQLAARFMWERARPTQNEEERCSAMSGDLSAAVDSAYSSRRRLNAMTPRVRLMSMSK